VAGVTRKGRPPDCGPGGARPVGTPRAIQFTRLLLLVQGSIVAIATVVALAGPGGIGEPGVIGAIVAMALASACILVGISLRRGRSVIAAAAIVLEGLWTLFTGLFALPFGDPGAWGLLTLPLGIASVTAFAGLLSPPARSFSSSREDRARRLPS
jgi:hypothetical protein